MYSHIVDLADVLQDKVSKRLYELQATLGADDEEVRKLFLNFQKELLSAEDTEEGFMDSIFTCLDSEAILRMEDMLAGPIGRFVRFVLSEDYFDLFKQFLKIEELCAFSLSSMYIPLRRQASSSAYSCYMLCHKRFICLRRHGSG